MLKINIVKMFITLWVLFGVTVANAGEQYIKKGYAVSGYDTVAYFTLGKATKGDKSIEAEWNGAKWLFASEEHKQLFLDNPEKYAPAYDGHCAYAAGVNQKASAKPTLWSIENDRLFLNYNKKINKKWLEDKDNYIEEGDKNWPELGKKPAVKGLFG